MDNYPEPVVLPRERSDEQSAKTLSQILPVVQEYNHFEQVYSDNWWEKLKHGTAVYGVFWDSRKDNGLGDIEIRNIDLLNLFWEPGITDIQKSRNLFIVDLVDNDLLDSEYPQLRGKQKGKVVDVKEYIYDDTVDTSEKSVVVDWYYKVKTPSGRTALHYIKFVGSTLLYASENDPEYRERGFYDHGMYPVVLDLVLRTVHAAKHNLRAGGETPCVVAAVVPRLWIRTGVIIQRLVDQLPQLGERLAQDQRLVPGDMHLPQRLYHQRVALASDDHGAGAGIGLYRTAGVD